MTALLDASFLTHALLPGQQTTEATLALSEKQAGGERTLVWDGHVFEVASVLRKAVTRRRLDSANARAILQRVLVEHAVVTANESLILAGFELASRLGQSDTFDATGYLVAAANGADFWVSDRRFANAAFAAGLPHVHYVA